MNILIIGGSGFIGKNLLTTISERENINVSTISYQLEEDEIFKNIKGMEFIIHLAGVNRSKNSSDFYEGNVNITEKICNANIRYFKESGIKVPIIFTSSIHADQVNHYGKSKAKAEEILKRLNKTYKVPVYILRLPNVFGKWCKPNYNSFVTTIFYNIARDISIDYVNTKKSLKLLYIDDLVNLILNIIDKKKIKIISHNYVEIENIYSAKLTDILNIINKFKDANNSLILDGVGEGLTKALYSTYLSYLPKEKFEYTLKHNKDERGLFVEFFKTTNSGQFSFFTAKPNITRGEHYHNSKSEKFIVCQGKARFCFKNLENDDTHTIYSSADEFKVINSIPGWVHSITNVGNENLIVLLWGNELFDKNNPDTFYHPLDASKVTESFESVKKRIKEEESNLSGEFGMKKLKILTILGTRPEIIKLSRIINKLDLYSDQIIVHTGQNYDFELNQIFFKELMVRKPDYFLDCASDSDSTAKTIGNIISSVDDVLEKEVPDAILVLGDTNSCLSVISAKRRKIPIFHYEAGNRCFDKRVPEEINRIIVDHTADINLTYSDIARQYLIKEGLPPDQIIKIGSPMREVLNFYSKNIEKSTIIEELELTKFKYFVVSAHREENIDSKNGIFKLAEMLNDIASKYSYPLIFSTHPRTQKKLKECNLILNPLIKCLKPMGLKDYLNLQINSKLVLSDSGTITEESSILNFPALNLREAHERPEGMEEGSVMMVGLNKERVFQGINILEKQLRGNSRNIHIIKDYSPDNVSDKILRIIHSYTDFVNRVVWKKY